MHHDVLYPLAVEADGGVGLQLPVTEVELGADVLGDQLRLT